MPISSKGFARTSLALIVVGLMALIGIVGTTIWLVERTQVYFEAVVQARAERAAAVELRNLLQDAQTGQRGYLLTLDEDYLEPYNAAIGEIGAAYERLVEIMAPYPDMDAPIAQLRTDVDTKLTELAQTVAMAQAGQLSQALSVVRTDVGQELMIGIRAVLDGIIEAADTRAFEGVIDQRGAATGLRLAAVLGALIILAVVGGAAWVVLRYTREIDQARNAVEMLNRDLEARVAERTSDLRRANEEVQRFAYIVTHDLRAPLVNIMGFTSELDAALGPINALIARQPEDEDDTVLAEARQTAQEDLPEAIGFIRSSTRKMDALINAILKISREGRRELKAERLDLEDVAEAAVAAVRHQIDETGGAVDIDIATPPVFSDRLAFEQILGNLLDNAIKYRHPDRPVRIGVKGWQERDGRIVIEVGDNGRGISAEDHDRVFELFRRSGTQDRPGEGIGLAHVRIMARNLGGEITLRSEPGKSTTFTVTLAPDLRAIARSKF